MYIKCGIVSLLVGFVLLFASWDAAPLAAEQSSRLHYVGSESCIECHAQSGFAARNSGHVRTWYANLAQTMPDWSDDLALLCDDCHAAGQREEALGIGFSCETCHGPGSAHIRNVGAGGLYPPDPAVCTTCHYDITHDWATLHASDPSVIGEYVATLHMPLFGSTPPDLTTCTDCHVPDERWEGRLDAAFLDELRAIDTLNCTRCHDPHHLQIGDPS